MPRRPTRSAPIPSPPPPPVVPDNVATLGTQWKWANFSQFFFTFSHLFNLPDISIHDIERDLLNDTSVVLPKIMQRLLYTLSYDRKVSLSNWQTALRKQYNKRDPAANPIGPEPERAPGSPHEADDDEHTTDAPEDGPPSTDQESLRLEGSQQDSRVSQSRQPSQQVSAKTASPPPNDGHPSAQTESLDWLHLPMLTKLESMHTLIEWQFQNPGRLRTLMRSDDEHATWRIEPIGYDSKSNAYWLIGTDRLWLQRSPPRRPKPLKRKRAAPKKGSNTSVNTPTPSSKRARVQPTNSLKSTRSSSVVEPSSGRKSRAAKDQAKLKLDAQARALSQLQQDAATSSVRSKTRSVARRRAAAPPPRASLGTRVSARLRGQKEEDEEEWQPIPDDWLDDKKKPAKPPRTGLESDEDSELTELSDESPESEQEVSPTKEESEDEEPSPVVDDPEPQAEQAEFVEWELICATLDEWEHIADRFANATHYTEKALFKVLTNDIVPIVVEELRDALHKQQLEEAMSHRKRSSRLAIRESEREEARLEAKRKAEEMEKMGRARRLEARQQREEAERLKREKAREQRRLERELREEKRHAPPPPSPPPEPPVVVQEPSKPANKPRKREHKATAKTSKASEDWELFCEICNQHAINPKDTSPVVSCGYCSRWQHIGCHDRADSDAGRPPRDWKRADFICRRCYSTRTNGQSHSHTYSNNGHQFNRAPSYQNASHHYNGASTSHNGFQNGYNSKETAYTYYQQPPSNGHFQQPVQSRYPPPSHSTMQYLAGTQSSAPARQNISFSHYQPAQRNFMPVQKSYAELSPQQAYGQVGHYNQQPYGSTVGTYKQPAMQQQMWTPPPPPQPSNYPAPHHSHTNPHQSSGYRPYTTGSRDFTPANGTPYGSGYATHSPHYPQATPLPPPAQQVRQQSSSYSSSMGGP